jgi:hypothetical protein
MTSISARGRNGTVHFDGNFVTIERSGFIGRATHGKGDNRYPIASLSAVRFKPGSSLIYGFIEFVVGGGQETKRRTSIMVSEGADNPNAVTLTKAQTPEMAVLRDAIEAAITAHHNAPSTTVAPAGPSIPEQIRQLADLRDSGILTDAEFEAKKASLLAQM